MKAKLFVLVTCTMSADDKPDAGHGFIALNLKFGSLFGLYTLFSLEELHALLSAGSPGSS